MESSQGKKSAELRDQEGSPFPVSFRNTLCLSELWVRITHYKNERAFLIKEKLKLVTAACTPWHPDERATITPAKL